MSKQNHVFRALSPHHAIHWMHEMAFTFQTLPEPIGTLCGALKWIACTRHNVTHWRRGARATENTKHHISHVNSGVHRTTEHKRIQVSRRWVNRKRKRHANCHKNNKYLICWDYSLTPGKTLKSLMVKTYGPLVASRDGCVVWRWSHGYSEQWSGVCVYPQPFNRNQTNKPNAINKY